MPRHSHSSSHSSNTSSSGFSFASADSINRATTSISASSCNQHSVSSHTNSATTWTCNPVVLPAVTLSCRHQFHSRTRTIIRCPTAHPRCPHPLIRFTLALIYAKDHVCPATEPMPAAKPTSHVTSALPHSPVNNPKSVHPLPSFISCLVYHLLSLVSSFSFISHLSSHFIMRFSFYLRPIPSAPAYCLRHYASS